MLPVQVLRELLWLLTGLLHGLSEISICKTMRCRVIRLQCLQECFLFLCKKKKKKKRLFPDVELKYLLLLMLLSEANWEAKSQTQWLLWIPSQEAEHSQPPDSGPSRLVVRKKANPSNLKKESSSPHPGPRPLNPTKFCDFLGNGLG